MANIQETTSAVDHLLELLYERIFGFEKAIENVKDPEIKAVFEYFAVQDQQFADELIPFSNKLNSSEISNKVHAGTGQIWKVISNAVSSGNRNSVVESCISEEKEVIAKYEEMFNQKLNPELKGILARQVSDMKKTLNISILLQAVYFK